MPCDFPPPILKNH